MSFEEKYNIFYNFIFNNMKAPWNDVNVRLAVNYAINRQQISDIGYEGANYPEIIPFSAYMAPNWVPGRIQELLDKYDRGTPSQEKVDEHMAAAGFEPPNTTPEQFAARFQRDIANFMQVVREARIPQQE